MAGMYRRALFFFLKPTPYVKRGRRWRNGADRCPRESGRLVAVGAPTLPEGPVTIMFTDIEGSTALRTSLGDAETDTLFRRHDELVKEQIEAHQGYDQGAA